MPRTPRSEPSTPCHCCGRSQVGGPRFKGGRVHFDCWDEHHSDPTGEWPRGTDPISTELIAERLRQFAESQRMDFSAPDTALTLDHAADALEAHLAETARLQAVIDASLAATENAALMDDPYGTHVDRKVLHDILTSAGSSSALEAVKAAAFDEGNNACRAVYVSGTKLGPVVNPYRAVESGAKR